MKIRYDKETDSKYIEVTASKKNVSCTKKEKDWLLFDYDEKGKIMGIEILDASEHPVAFSFTMDDEACIRYFPIANCFTEEGRATGNEK